MRSAPGSKGMWEGWWVALKHRCHYLTTLFPLPPSLPASRVKASVVCIQGENFVHRNFVHLHEVFMRGVYLNCKDENCKNILTVSDLTVLMDKHNYLSEIAQAPQTIYLSKRF